MCCRYGETGPHFPGCIERAKTSMAYIKRGWVDLEKTRSPKFIAQSASPKRETPLESCIRLVWLSQALRWLVAASWSIVMLSQLASSYAKWVGSSAEPTVRSSGVDQVEWDASSMMQVQFFSVSTKTLEDASCFTAACIFLREYPVLLLSNEMIHNQSG